MKHTYFLKSIVIGALLLFVGNVYAQMVGPNVYLKGKYVEVGIGIYGAYGADSAPPGYHPKCDGCWPTYGTPGYSLGFVADPGMTGWSTSSASHYEGDYFLPGAPFEGWELQVNGPRCQNNNNGSGCTTGTDTGSNISYTATGSTVTGTWQGMIDSIQVTQLTILDTLDLYFTIKVILTNMAVAPKNNIYYERSLDPDNDEQWPGGGFITDNVVEHQSTDTTVVSATGPSSPLAYLALGTTDTNATAFVYDSWPLTESQDLAAVYSETYGPPGSGAQYTQGVHDTGDIGIGLVIYIPHLATVDSAADSVYRTTSTTSLHPANTATFTYFYAFSTAAVDSAIKGAHTTSGTPALGVQNVNSTPAINVYPNPARNSINITGLNTGDHLSMYDMMGRVIAENAVNNQGTYTLPMNNIPPGAYIIIVQDANGNVKARVPVRKQ